LAQTLVKQKNNEYSLVLQVEHGITRPMCSLQLPTANAMHVFYAIAWPNDIG